jgi:hypothetical protein
MPFAEKTWENGEGVAAARMNAAAMNDLEGRVGAQFDVTPEIEGAPVDGSSMEYDDDSGLWVPRRFVREDELPWRIDVNVLLPRDLTVGTWLTQQANTLLMAGWIANSPAAQNDEVGWDLIIAKGTWNLSFIAATTVASAIASVRIDDVGVGTADLYASPTVLNVTKTIAGVVVASTGKKRVSLKAATRNALNTTGWTMAVSALGLRRTA